MKEYSQKKLNNIGKLIDETPIIKDYVNELTIAYQKAVESNSEKHVFITSIIELFDEWTANTSARHAKCKCDQCNIIRDLD